MITGGHADREAACAAITRIFRFRGVTPGPIRLILAHPQCSSANRAFFVSYRIHSPNDEQHRSFQRWPLSLDVASEQCPHCGAVNLFPGFSRMMAYFCREHGEGVQSG